MEKAELLAQICALLAAGDRAQAVTVARAKYPFEGRPAAARRYSRLQAVRIFVRDGFIDRYSGHRLVYPGALLLLSRLMPDEFPTHPNWKMSATHFAYWELWPTVDHVVPVARGGRDEEANWVCTSMLRNAAKAHWTVAELGWALFPPGEYAHWVGLTGWFCRSVDEEGSHLTDGALAAWYGAATAALSA